MKVIDIRTAFFRHNHWPFTDKPSPTPPGPNPPSPIDPDDPESGLDTYIDFVLDEDKHIFFPITVLDAVIDKNKKSAATYFKEIHNRLKILENAAGSPIVPRFVNNLVTNAETAGLTAAMGKKLYDILKTGDITTDGEVNFIVDGAVVTAKVADAAIIGEKIAEGVITEQHLTEGCVTTSILADATVTKDKLDEELTKALDTIQSFDEYKKLTDKRLEKLEEDMKKHVDTDKVLTDQNEHILHILHKWKQLSVNVKALNPATGIYRSTVSIEDVRMSGMVTKLTWAFVDQKEIDDAEPETFRLMAVIDYADGTTEERVLSTDKGYNGIEQTIVVKNISAPCVIHFKAIVEYCWLTYENDGIINVTE